MWFRLFLVLQMAWPVALSTSVAAGLSLLFWRYATIPEVFAGAALTSVLLITTALLAPRSKHPLRCALWVGLAFASGVANHHSVILLWPLPVFALLQLKKQTSWRQWSALVGASALISMMAGFLPYLYLLGPSPGLLWGHKHDLTWLTGHFLRRAYGTFKLSSHAGDTSGFSHLAHYLSGLPERMFGVFFLLALIGLFVSLRNRAQRGNALSLLAAWIMAGPLFVTRFNISLRGLNAFVVERFYIVPDLLLYVFAALGLQFLWRRSLTRHHTLSALLVVSLALQFYLNLPRARHDNTTRLEDAARYTLKNLPQNAVLIAGSDSQGGSLAYLQEVRGLRPDVIHIFGGLYQSSWYRDFLRQKYPGIAALITAGPSLKDLVLRIVHSSHPLFIASTDISPQEFPSAIELATATHIYADPSQVPGARQIENELRLALQRSPFRQPLVPDNIIGERNDMQILLQLGICYLDLARHYKKEGDLAGMKRALERAQTYTRGLLHPDEQN